MEQAKKVGLQIRRINYKTSHRADKISNCILFIMLVVATLLLLHMLSFVAENPESESHCYIYRIRNRKYRPGSSRYTIKRRCFENNIGSCAGVCNANYNSSLPCQCNVACPSYNNCCEDYKYVCANAVSITDEELTTLGQQIWNADGSYRVAPPNLNFQGQTSDGSTEDHAKDKLFSECPSGFNTEPVYTKQIALFDDYTRDETVPEDLTPDDWDEIDDFLTEVMSTQPMQLVHNFLASKGIVSSNNTEFQATLKLIWYSLYVRDGALSSSGAEHVQVGEIDGDEVSGFHNWVHFCLLEQSGNVNYLGYVRYMELGDSTYLIHNPFYWDTYFKPVNGFFIGTSPSFDMSVFTLCFYARPNSICNLTINGHSFPIQTYTMDYNSNVLVGSSYPNY